MSKGFLQASRDSNSEGDSSDYEESVEALRAGLKYPKAMPVCAILLVLYLWVPVSVLTARELVRVDNTACDKEVSYQVGRLTAGNRTNTQVVQLYELIQMSSLLGVRQTSTLSAFVLSVIAATVVAWGTVPATMIVTYTPQEAEPDFEQKGTISNTTQNAMKPHGRIWSVALFTASMLLLISMNSLWLYRKWHDVKSDLVRPISRNLLPNSLKTEIASTCWVTIPNVGFLFTAVIPSLSGAVGHKVMLTAVHNVCAPLSMLYLAVMETYQLSHIEKAFEYFFSNSVVPGFGQPLSDFQRLRVVTLILAWSVGLVFVSVQAYLTVGPLVLKKKNHSYSLALVSYFGEVIGLILVFSLPALAGVDIVFYNSTGACTKVASQLLYDFNTPVELHSGCDA